MVPTQLGGAVPDIPYALLIILIILAVLAGLWVGRRANTTLAEREKSDEGWSLTTSLRKAATNGVITLWRWNRDRQARAKANEKAKPN